MSDPQKLAAAPTHVPPPRTAFLEHCEVEIYEGLTYVRLDDVMHLLSEGAPSEQQVERAAKAMQNESGGFFSLESWRHLARVALTAAGVAPQPVVDEAALAEVIADAPHSGDPNVSCLDPRCKAAAVAAWLREGVALQEPNQNETKSGNNFVSLDPEKVRQVIAPFFNNDADSSWGLFSPEDTATRALCEAYTEGKLT